ncbi:histone-arginine methyltransferase CARMER isoform X3 [Ischnura elegans]|uniref:histone-arginine methyltransferase CARMER isoform X3 n=1 Tax=Ischnura elegans TaxID=197161 RepID=UPI001ED8A459|nr:histone-arginine methyltransferase CARMER isoform X3 [Ischnura elegans]
MARIFRQVRISCLGNDLQLHSKYDFPVIVSIDYDPQGLSIKIRKDNYASSQDLMEFPVNSGTDCSKVGSMAYLFNLEQETLLLKFNSDIDSRNFHTCIVKVKSGKGVSVFTERTDDSSAMQYFQFYGYLSQQQNMMQDYIRTSTYQRAILANLADFKDKVVLDVGAGSGILSFFAIQAGARKVYAVEASTMAQHAEALINANNLKGKIVVIAGKIEEIEIPESVNVIISEPMGYMLYNERMLETYLHAKKWLLPNGRMFPSRGDLHIAPFSDDTLYMEQFNKANFWYQQCFHGVDLSSLRQAAMKEYFRQPIVDTFDIRICMAKSLRHSVDFQLANEIDLHKIEIPLEFHLLDSGTVHGLAFWFDVAFIGSSQTIWLSTAPTESLTHWYQVRCLLETPIFVKQGQLLTGRVLLLANKRQSYDVTIELCVEGTGTRSSNTLDLKNPYFRYTGQAPQAPPGQNTTSPSENYWSHLDAQAVNMVNGISVNGLGEVSIDAGQTAANLIGLDLLGNQPNIHPGSISSTGRQRVGQRTATSTQATQLIGGGISPTLFTSSKHVRTLKDGLKVIEEKETSGRERHEYCKSPRVVHQHMTVEVGVERTTWWKQEGGGSRGFGGYAAAD